jgi:hypothetical protein
MLDNVKGVNSGGYESYWKTCRFRFSGTNLSNGTEGEEE